MDVHAKRIVISSSQSTPVKGFIRITGLFSYTITGIYIVFKEQLVSALTQNNAFDLSGSLIDINEIHHSSLIS